MYFCIALINRIVLTGTLSLLTRPGPPGQYRWEVKAARHGAVGLDLTTPPPSLYLSNLHFLSNSKSTQKKTCKSTKYKTIKLLIIKLLAIKS